MSHEFLITDAPEPKAAELSDPYAVLARLEKGRCATFQGYADGAMYKAFAAEEFRTQFSGAFGGRTIRKAEAQKGLQEAIRMLATYPDPARADDLKRYLAEVVMPATDDTKFYIHFY